MSELFENNQPLLINHPLRLDNLFVAFLPPRGVAGHLSETGFVVRKRHSRQGRSRPTNHLHLTLFHVGNFAGLPASKVAAAKRACAATASLSRAFAVHMDQAACWKKGKGNIPLVLSVRGRNRELDLFRQQVVIQCAKQGLRDKKKAFNPHVTLAYINESFGTQSIEPISWLAEEIVLIHSLMGQTKYIELGRWKLGA